MKYRTVLELICDAADAEDASNMAGDYLRGEIDFGVTMKCKTRSLRSHRVRKYTVSSLIAILTFSTLLLKVTPIGDVEKTHGSVQPGFRSTYAVMPALKTKHRVDFKKEWAEKKSEAVMEYLKK